MFAVTAMTVVLPATACTGVGAGREKRSTGRSSDAVSTSAGLTRTPRWAARCFPRRAADRAGAATEYVGLTPAAAGRLAKARGDVLLVVGGDGRCEHGSDLVRYTSPVAVVVNHRAGTHIVAALRVSAQWRYHGWRLVTGR